MLEVHQKILRIWKLPGGLHPDLPGPVEFHLSEDKQYWNAHTGVMCEVYKEGETEYFHLKVNEQFKDDHWEAVRKYAVKHLLPIPGSET